MDSSTRTLLENVARDIVTRRAEVMGVLVRGHVPDLVPLERARSQQGPDAQFSLRVHEAQALLDDADSIRPSRWLNWLRSDRSGPGPRVVAALDALRAVEPYVGTEFDSFGVGWTPSSRLTFIQTRPAARLTREARGVLGSHLSDVLNEEILRASYGIRGESVGRQSAAAGARLTIRLPLHRSQSRRQTHCATPAPGART